MAEKTTALIPPDELEAPGQEVQKIEESLRRGEINKAMRRSLSNHMKMHLWKTPLLFLQHARLVGHLGEYSEALRICELLRTGAEDEIVRQRAGIWAGVYWSRLYELEQSTELLQNHPAPPGDSQMISLRWSHLLSNAVESNDYNQAVDLLDSVDDELAKISPGDRERFEIEIWRSLLSILAQPSPPDEQEVRQRVESAERLVRESDNITILPHLYFRAGKAYERTGALEAAEACYQNSRHTALSLNSNAAFVRAALASLELARDHGRLEKSETKRLVEQLAIVSGQIGFGTLPCELLRMILRVINELGDDVDRQLNWLMNERYLPDLGRLKGRVFEKWCFTLLDKHQEELLGLKGFELEEMGEGEEAIDLIARYTQPNIVMGIQCKGGVEPWSKNRGICLPPPGFDA